MGFPNPGRAADQHVVLAPDVVAPSQPEQVLPTEAWIEAEVEIFQSLGRVECRTP